MLSWRVTLTTERAQLVRDYITKHAPSWCSFNITDVAEYLGFLLGPKGGLTSWKKAVGNYYKTTKIIAAANLSPTLGFDLYNMRAAPSPLVHRPALRHYRGSHKS